MNTGNKLNKPKKKSASLKPASPKPKAVAKPASPKAKSVTSLKTISSNKLPVNKSASKAKKALAPTPVLLNAPLPKPLQTAAKNKPKQHTRKRYVDISLIIDKLRANSNAANNFEDSYKIEGEGMTRAEYKRLKS